MPKDTRYVIESSSVWERVYNCMAHDPGLDVILSNPYKTRLIAESKKKTDKVDTFILADMLRGGYVAESHVPDKEVIKARQLVRYRHDKVQQRTQCKNTIHGILLQGAVTMGKYTALVMSSAIDSADRFTDSHSLVAYFGSAPTVRNTADKVHHGRIKKGDKLVRHVLVEAVHNHVRFMPHSKLTQSYRRIQAKRGTSKAAVATASKMTRIMYQMLKNGREF